MPHPIDEFVGLRVREERKLAGFSQKELAVQIGTSFQQVQKYEIGSNRISGSRIWQIAQSLNVPVSSFFPSDDPRESTTVFYRPDFDQLCVLQNLSLIPEREQKAIKALLEALAQRQKRI